jgi:hypothetical protein
MVTYWRRSNAGNEGATDLLLSSANEDEVDKVTEDCRHLTLENSDLNRAPRRAKRVFGHSGVHVEGGEGRLEMGWREHGDQLIGFLQPSPHLTQGTYFGAESLPPAFDA